MSDVEVVGKQVVQANELLSSFLPSLPSLPPPVFLPPPSL